MPVGSCPIAYSLRTGLAPNGCFQEGGQRTEREFHWYGRPTESLDPRQCCDEWPLVRMAHWAAIGLSRDGSRFGIGGLGPLNNFASHSQYPHIQEPAIVRGHTPSRPATCSFCAEKIPSTCGIQALPDSSAVAGGLKCPTGTKKVSAGCEKNRCSCKVPTNAPGAKGLRWVRALGMNSEKEYVTFNRSAGHNCVMKHDEVTAVQGSKNVVRSSPESAELENRDDH
jgi:hypothetical protein